MVKNGLQMSINGRAGYCTAIEDTQGVHPRKLKLIKQKVSQDTINELRIEDEENLFTEEEKQDFGSSSEDLIQKPQQHPKRLTPQ